MYLDVVDFRILKLMYRDMEAIYYIKEISGLLRLRRSMTRLRLKKLAKMGMVKEVKTYPSYFIPNPVLKERVDEINVPMAIRVRA